MRTPASSSTTSRSARHAIRRADNCGAARRLGRRPDSNACTSPTYKNVVTDGLQTAGAAASRPGGRSEFEHSRADVIEMNRRRLALGNDSVPANLDGLLTIDRTLPRLAALKALQEDDRLLASLVATTPPGEVGAAPQEGFRSIGQCHGCQHDRAGRRARGDVPHRVQAEDGHSRGGRAGSRAHPGDHRSG